MDSFPFVIISAKAGRGYGVDDVSAGISEHQLFAIQQSWAPGGQGWSRLIGAQFVRTIVLPNNSLGWIQLEVTPEHDEFGRRGLLLSKTSVIPSTLVSKFAEDYLATTPSSVRKISQRYMPRVLAQFFLGQLGLSWRMFWKRQTIITAPFSPTDDWSLVNAIIIRLFLSLPEFLRASILFSTLCLSPKNAGLLIGIPSEHLGAKADINLAKIKLE